MCDWYENVLYSVSNLMVDYIIGIILLKKRCIANVIWIKKKYKDEKQCANHLGNTSIIL